MIARTLLALLACISLIGNAIAQQYAPGAGGALAPSAMQPQYGSDPARAAQFQAAPTANFATGAALPGYPPATDPRGLPRYPTAAAPPTGSVLPPYAGSPGYPPAPNAGPPAGSGLVDPNFAMQSRGPAVGPAPRNASMRALASAQIIARVGDETILASDVYPQVDGVIRAKLATLTPEQRASIPAEVLESQHNAGAKQLLDDLIETKVIYADAIRNIPKENLPALRQNMMDQFEKNQVKSLMEKNKIATRAELEAKMAESGQSMERAKQLYFEKGIASSWMYQHSKDNREIPHAELLGEYQRNIEDYKVPGRARWEQLQVQFDRFSNKTEAYNAIAAMGDEVLRGKPFAEVATAKSHGPTASNGGLRDWTTKGALKCAALDANVFLLPVGSMSPIIEDVDSYHIVRVIEREDAYVKEFLAEQVAIAKKLKDQSQKRKQEEFIAKVRKRTPITTIFDNQRNSAGGNEAVVGLPTDPPR